VAACATSTVAAKRINSRISVDHELTLHPDHSMGADQGPTRVALEWEVGLIPGCHTTPDSPSFGACHDETERWCGCHCRGS
jgi:hypothetical protein